MANIYGRKLPAGIQSFKIIREEEILDRQYMEPFKADKRQVIGLGIELDEEGKGLLSWKRTE